MSTKLIDLSGLSAYKTSSDAKYQDKLTAGSGITISGNTISATGSTPSYIAPSMSNPTVASGTLTKVGEVTLQPGTYIIQYTCQFQSNANGGYRQCGFSTNTTNIDGGGDGSWDSRAVASGVITQTWVTMPVIVSASDYPNGRTFYMLARQNSGSSLTVYPRAYFLKFG